MAIQDGVWYVQSDNSSLWKVFTIINDVLMPPTKGRNGSVGDFVKTNGEVLENTHPMHAEIIAILPGGYSSDSAIHSAAAEE